MSTLVLEEDPVAANVTVTGDKLTVELADGRSLTVPLSWYPRLMHGTDAERGNWQLLGDGHAIEWPDSTNTSIAWPSLVTKSGKILRSSSPGKESDMSPSNIFHPQISPKTLFALAAKRLPIRLRKRWPTSKMSGVASTRISVFLNSMNPRLQ